MQNYRVFEKVKKIKECSYYYAQNRLTKEIVTIKKLSNKYIWEEVLNRKDIALMKLCKYSFLPNIHEIIKDNNKFFIILQKLTDNLDDLKKKTMQISQILDLAIQILQSIVALHKQNIILFDIRPQYFFYGQKTLKIGHLQMIPKIQANQQLDLIEWQDLKYSAPESILTTKKIDQKSNLFSFGCILCELILGKQLIQAKTKMDYIYAITELFPKQNIQQEQKIQTKQINSFQNRIKKICGKQLINLLSDILKIDRSQRISADKALERLKIINKNQLFKIDKFQQSRKSIPKLNIVKLEYPKIQSNRSSIDIPKQSNIQNNDIIFNFENQQDNQKMDKVLEILKITKPLKSQKNIEDDVTQAIIIKKLEGTGSTNLTGTLPELPIVKLQNLNLRTPKKLSGKPQLTNFALNDHNLGVKLGNSFFNDNDSKF